MKEKDLIKLIVNSVKRVVGKKTSSLHEPIFYGNEKKYLNKCIDTGYVSYVGKFVNLFEKKICNYTKSKHAVALINGTSAIHILLKYLGVDKNDEVLLPSLTFVATANAIKYCNASPNFLDIEEDTLGISPEKLEKYLKKIAVKKKNYSINRYTKKKLKVLIAVHLFGLPCNIHKIKKICSKYKIKVIEDAAEAMGSFYKNKHLGNFSEAGVISFNGNKTITCGGGAVIISSNKKLIDTIRHLSTTAKVKHPWEYIHNDIGFNYRMTNLNAAVGCAQIENITKIISSKRKNLTAYKNIFKKIKDVKIFDEPINSKSNFWLITAMFQKKIKYKVLKELNKQGCNARAIWKPLHTLQMYKKCQKDNLNTSLKIYNSSINLPSSPKINLIK
jgi:perosamine synthetase